MTQDEMLTDLKSLAEKLHEHWSECMAIDASELVALEHAIRDLSSSQEASKPQDERSPAKPSDMGEDYAGPDCEFDTCDLVNGECACTRKFSAASQPSAASGRELHSLVAGALFDFMGGLTTQPERLVLSACDEASPAVAAIEAFAKKRGLDLTEANVSSWSATLTGAAPADKEAAPTKSEKD